MVAAGHVDAQALLGIGGRVLEVAQADIDASQQVQAVGLALAGTMIELEGLEAIILALGIILLVRLIDFRNTVIIMTSNAGTRQLKEFGRGVGFTAGGSMGLSLDERDKEHARQIVQKALSKQFSPEFLNRLDEIITFDQLDLEAIKRIIDIELVGLYKRISQMGYELQLTDAAKEFVATKGYDVQFGARPLKRAIQNYIEDVVCEHILNGDITTGSTIKLDKLPEQEELTILETQD